MSDAGRGLHGILTVTSPLTRKGVVQQLLVGDLADLADEGLYQLLPSGLEKLQAGRKKDLKKEQSERLAKSKQQTLNPSLWKKSQNGLSVGKLGLAEDALCYVSLEQKVFHQLKRSHAETQLVQALRDRVFPELNLKSYLDCRSDLALPAIRQILSRRQSRDEALELDRSLTKALTNQNLNHKHNQIQKTTTAIKKNVPVVNYGGAEPAIIPRNPNNLGYPHPWLLPMEWED